MTVVSVTVQLTTKPPHSQAFNGEHAVSLSVDITRLYGQLMQVVTDNNVSLKEFGDLFANTLQQSVMETTLVPSIIDQSNGKCTCVEEDPDVEEQQRFEGNRLSHSRIEEEEEMNREKQVLIQAANSIPFRDPQLYASQKLGNALLACDALGKLFRQAIKSLLIRTCWT